MILEYRSSFRLSFFAFGYVVALGPVGIFSTAVKSLFGSVP